MFAALMASQQAAAHGYVSSPADRAFLCSQGKNGECGAASTTPHGAGEAPNGMFDSGALDGKIPGLDGMSALNVQTEGRWTKHEIKDRNITFNWFYTTGHDTKTHKYYITKQGWDQNKPLTRDMFDTEAFCEAETPVTVDVPWGGKDDDRRHPTGDPVNLEGPGKYAHECVLPDDRTGYHVIMGSWEIGDIDNTWSKPIDVNIVVDAPAPDGWEAKGDITPNVDLLAGDKVKMRAFGKGTEAQYETELTISNEQEGKRDMWSFLLAERINETQELVTAGVQDAEGNIKPVKGNNKIFAKAESGVDRFEVDTFMVPDSSAEMTIAALVDGLELKNGRATIDVPMETNREMNVDVSIIAEGGKLAGKTKQSIQPGSTSVPVDVVSEPGAHQVIVVGTTANGRASLQDTVDIELGGEGSQLPDYDYAYPEGLSSFKTGTKVMNDGKIYECTEGGWCSQATTQHAYEPGKGWAWGEAWKLLK
jgi:chitin-binding protein